MPDRGVRYLKRLVKDDGRLNVANVSLGLSHLGRALGQSRSWYR